MLGRVTRVGIGEKEGMKRMQKNGLKLEDLLQVFGSVARFTREVSVNFTEVIYEYICMSLFFS